MLDAADKRRHARHLLLTEIGEAGQARLLSKRVSIAPSADPGAAAVAREYLQRAGLHFGEGGAALALPDQGQVRALAGDAALTQAAAALAGAFAAVEAIKATLGIGSAGSLQGLCLKGDA